MIDAETHLDDFIRGYTHCLLWSTNDESTPSGGVPLDENYSPEDIYPSALARIKRDCEEFFNNHKKDIAKEEQERSDRRIKAGGPVPPITGPESIWAEAGYDFWLTRNDHGCGFWDGDWEETRGEKLTKASKSFGNEWPYVGDDGLIHLSME